MSKLSLIVIFILLGTVYTRQIGLIANHVFTYGYPVNNSSVTIVPFGNTASCNACICAAFMSSINYVAINCYTGNNTCFLLNSLVNITGVISSYSNSAYILSNLLIPLTTTTAASSTTLSTINGISLSSTSANTISTATSTNLMPVNNAQGSLLSNLLDGSIVNETLNTIFD